MEIRFELSQAFRNVGKEFIKKTIMIQDIDHQYLEQQVSKYFYIQEKYFINALRRCQSDEEVLGVNRYYCQQRDEYIEDIIDMSNGIFKKDQYVL